MLLNTSITCSSLLAQPTSVRNAPSKRSAAYAPARRSIRTAAKTSSIESLEANGESYCRGGPRPKIHRSYDPEVLSGFVALCRHTACTLQDKTLAKGEFKCDHFYYLCYSFYRCFRRHVLSSHKHPLTRPTRSRQRSRRLESVKMLRSNSTT